MALALARKYRPRSFAAVAVQTHVSRTLKGAIARGRIAHGYLLCGPRGTGKTTLARVLAMALNCERRLSGEIPDEGEPCGECPSCTRIWSGSASLDVVEIDAASNRGVDDARDLRERAMYAPSGDARYKVYIVDEAHMLTREAWNALLKILEEPPPRVVFVFATTEPQKIAQTAAPVLSRLQRFDLKRIGPAEIRERLNEILGLEGVQASDDGVGMIARAAEGSMRDALSLTDQVLASSEGGVTADAVREALGFVAEDELLALLDIVASRRAGDVFPAVARLADAGVDFTQLLAAFTDVLRALLALTLDSAAEMSERLRKELATRRSALSSSDIVRMLNIISALEPRFRRTTQQQLLFEILLVRFALLDRTVEIEEIIAAVEAGGVPPAPGGPTGRGGGTRAPAPPGDTRVDDRGAVMQSASDVSPPPGSAAPARQSERPAAAPRVELADAAPRAARAHPQAAPQPRPLDLNRIVEKWDDIVGAVKESGRVMLASHFANAIPSAVSGRGVVTLDLDERSAAAYDIVQEALNAAQSDVLRSVRIFFTGVEKVVIAPPRQAPDARSGAARRLTEEAMRAEKLENLRRKDPVLDAAVTELDLELLD